jgi:nucleotide-binding universal stress UspA family protein
MENISTLTPYYLAPVNVDSHISEHKELLRDQAQEWIESARANGVRVEIIFDESPGDITSTILNEAKKMHSGIIAMTSQTGPILASLLGSVTRQIVRQSPYPVCTIHPSLKPKEKTGEAA